MNTLTLIIDPEKTFTGIMKGHNYAVDVDVYKNFLPIEVKETLNKLCPVYRNELTESEAWQLIWELVRLLCPHIGLRVRVSDLTKPIR
ncbi:MAG: acetone carboxylase subunit gamma [Serratia fonticola]